MSDQLVDVGSETRGQTRPYPRVNVRPRAPESRVGRGVTDGNLVKKVRAANGFAKRAFDVIVASAALLALAPALIVIALLVKLSDGGAVLYRHKRVGRHGHIFECLKFRTMATNAEQRLEQILRDDPNAAAEWTTNQKLRSDPRVTRLGSLLRKTSLDELPQIINVLRGDMSLIGPRPVTRDELARYGRDRRFYLLVRPGITGLWQVSGRSSVGYERRVRLDRQYLEEWTWLSELWILIMTVPALFSTNDAC